MAHLREAASLAESGRWLEALNLMEETIQSLRQEGDQIGLARALYQKAVLKLPISAGEALALCQEAEDIFSKSNQPLLAFQARLTSSQALIAMGNWRPATRQLEECRYRLERLEPDFQLNLLIELRIAQLLVEAAYLGYQQRQGDLEDLYSKLLVLADQLEKVRRLRPGDFNTLWLFGELDLYERIVAVAYQLGLVTQAANWAERTKSRRLLGLLLNLPFRQENSYAR